MKKHIILLLIILIAAALRLYKLGEIPRGLYIDEPSIGYNAYTILHSFQDEYGNFLPLSFQAFGEYKLPVYIYGSVPLIALFGLNAFSVRLLSALAGIFATWGIYLLTKQQSSKTTALIAAALFAVSPWSLQFSRAAYEANLMLTFVIFALYFLFKYFSHTRFRYYLLFLLFSLLALYTYNAARIVLPLLILPLFFIHKKQFFRSPLHSLSTLIFILLLLFSVLGSSLGLESSRLKTVLELDNKQYQLGPVLGVTQKYLTHFSSAFLFFEGDIIARHSVRELGELYLPQLPFLLLGLYFLIRYKPKHWKYMLYLAILSPLPAAISTPVPHALRSIALLIPLTYLTAYGLSSTIQKIPLRIITIPVISLLFFYSLYTYLHVYYQHYAYRTSWDWGEQQTLLAEYLSTNYATAPHIYIESSPINLIYLKFFAAKNGQTLDTSRFTFSDAPTQLNLQNGDIVAISGWKGTPEQMTNTKELIMKNSSIGYKVGIWSHNAQ